MARQISVELLADATKMARSLDDAGRASATFGDKVRDAGKKMTVFATVPIAAFLGAATKAATEDEAAQAKLAQTLKSSAGASAAVVAGVERQLEAFMKVSTFSDDELRPAFENLIRTTGSVKESNDLMAAAMDLAAAKGIPLEQASLAIAKAHAGQLGPLNKLIPGMVDLKDKSLTFTDVQAKLNAVVGGAAAAALDTSAGRAQALKRDLGELTEQMGSALIPILNKVIGWVAPLIEKFSGMSSGTQTVILIVAGLVAAIGPLIGVVTALSTAMAFLAANPIVLIIAAIAALVAGLVWAYKNVGWFRDIVNNAFEGAKIVVQAMWRVVEPIFDAYVGYLETIWKVAGKVAGVAGKIGGAIGGVVGKLPGFQTGGIVPGTPGSPQLAMVHGGERILPLSRTGAAGGGNTYILTVQALDPTSAAEATVRAIDEWESRNGSRYARA
jgi:hypothetical protein